MTSNPPHQKEGQAQTHTPTPWTFDEVPTSCGRCFRIGSREIIDNHEAIKSLGARTLPAYACIYDDYGHGETVNKANAAFIVEACNAHSSLLASHERLKQALKEQVEIMEGAQDDDPSGYHRLGFDSFTLQNARTALSTAHSVNNG